MLVSPQQSSRIAPRSHSKRTRTISLTWHFRSRAPLMPMAERLHEASIVPDSPSIVSGMPSESSFRVRQPLKHRWGKRSRWMISNQATCSSGVRDLASIMLGSMLKMELTFMLQGAARVYEFKAWNTSIPPSQSAFVNLTKNRAEGQPILHRKQQEQEKSPGQMPGLFCFTNPKSSNEYDRSEIERLRPIRD